MRQNDEGTEIYVARKIGMEEREDVLAYQNYCMNVAREREEIFVEMVSMAVCAGSEASSIHSSGGSM